MVSEVASSTHPDLFKEVISFGATQETMFLQEVNLDKGDKQREVELRAPARWIQDIKVPTWIIEGKSLSSNYRDLKPMCNKNLMLHCAFIPNHDHFSVLYPINRYIAQQIMADQPISIKVDSKATAF